MSAHHPLSTSRRVRKASYRIGAQRDYSMRSRPLLSLVCGAILAGMTCVGTPSRTLAQLAPPVATRFQEPQQPIRVSVDLVNLFATVRDGKKRIVPDLEQVDFQVLEDGVEQKIANFSRETNLPITMGLLMDTSGSVQNLLAAEQEAASRFLQQVMRPSDLAMVISFDTDVDLLADFTADRGRLERAIERARINAPQSTVSVQGPFPTVARRSTAFYDAIYLACHEKLSREAGRKSLVILTDAADYGSKMRLEEALETAQRTDTVIHILLVHDPRFGSDWGAARKFAEETGGRVIEVQNEKDLKKAFDQISEELRTQYTLGYYSSNPARDGKFRKIKIELKKNGMKVLARKGYYAPRN